MRKLWVGGLFFIFLVKNVAAQGQHFPVSYEKIQKPYTDLTFLYTNIRVPKNIKAVSDFENLPKSNDADWIFNAKGVPFGKVTLVKPFPLLVYKSNNGYNETAFLVGGKTWLVYRRWF